MPFFFGGGGASASNMVGATSSAAGTAGLVPAPAVGDQTAFLSGSGSFLVPAVPILSKDSGQTQDVGAVNGSSVVFFGCPFLSGGSTGAVPASLKPLFCPTYIPKTDTYTRIAVTCNAGSAGTLFSLALYSLDEATGLPENLVTNVNSLSSASAATVEGTISQSLSQGWYWSAIMTDSTVPTWRIENNQTFSFIGTNQPWSGAARNALRILTVNTRSSITDWPSSLVRADLSISQNINNAFVHIAVRKV
jgi:hypothetical protein